MQLNEKGEWPTTKDVNIEKLKFEYIWEDEHDWIDIHYRISLGDKTYESNISDWTVDWECIRHDLENLIYHKKTELQLLFEDSPTKLLLEQYEVLDKDLEKEKGTGFAKVQLMKIEIIPDEFQEDKQHGFVGFAHYYDAIKALYQGLLLATYAYPVENKDGLSRLTAYNQIKSPLIEKYIKGDSLERDSINNRQIIIDEVLLIDPDVNSYIWDTESVGASVESYNDKDGYPIEMEELDKWAYEIEAIVIASETGKPYEKDWEDYHRRGITLAHKLRERLPASTDLWYAAPYEDKSGTIPQNILIL